MHFFINEFLMLSERESVTGETELLTMVTGG